MTATVASYLQRLPLNAVPTLQSPAGVKARRSTPEWAAFLTYLGWWMADVPSTDATMWCIVKVPTRACCAALIAFGAVLRSAAQPYGTLTWPEVERLPEGTSVFLRMVDKGGKKRTQHGIARTSSFPGMVQIEVEAPKYTHWITPATFRKFEVRLTEHETSPRSSAASNLLSKILPDFSPEWIHTPVTCCAVMTNQARWRQELTSIAVAVGRDSLELSHFLMPSHASDVPRVAVQGAKHVVRPECEMAILDGPAPFTHRDAAEAARVVVLLDAMEYGAQSNEIAAMVAARDEALLQTVLPDPLFQTAVFASRAI